MIFFLNFICNLIGSKSSCRMSWVSTLHHIKIIPSNNESNKWKWKRTQLCIGDSTKEKNILLLAKSLFNYLIRLYDDCHPLLPTPSLYIDSNFPHFNKLHFNQIMPNKKGRKRKSIKFMPCDKKKKKKTPPYQLPLTCLLYASSNDAKYGHGFVLFSVYMLP